MKMASCLRKISSSIQVPVSFRHSEFICIVFIIYSLISLKF
jgi:hypothetical protein